MNETTPYQIIGHGHFFQNTLLNHSRFIDFCKRRGLYIDEWRLERLEELGVFLPMLRVNYPVIKIKIETQVNKRGEKVYKELGDLEEGEIWDGEIREEYAAFIYFDKEYVDSWVKEGLVYIPLKENFLPWTNYQDDDGGYKIETFYSIFQVLPLKQLLQTLNFTCYTEDLALRTDEEILGFFRRHTKYFKSNIERFAEEDKKWERYARICQIISNRYLPRAESNDVTITVTSHPSKEEFDFSKYCREWNGKELLIEIGISVADIKDAWEMALDDADDSPISEWKELLDFIKKEKRNRLKDEALLAETFYTMANMLKLFYQDCTGEELYSYEYEPDPDEIFRRKGVSKDDFQYKEFIVNDYGLNPRPRLILVVEGEGEFNEIPKFWKQISGRSFADYKIQVINLKSIGEFTSKKIERFIDHFHDLQTIVYFVLDNENKSRQTRDALVRRQSRYIENFTITKEDFFTIWDKNIEFDNFTDEEIAESMKELCESRCVFGHLEIENCRASFGSGSDPLSHLYKEKLNYGLDKPQLLSILFDKIKQKPKIKIEALEKNRPIVDVIRKITHLALKNYQPTRLKRWQEAQNSGWLRNSY